MKEVDHIQQLKEEMKIMISMESDSEKQLFLLNFYKLNKNNGADFLKEMLEGAQTIPWILLIHKFYTPSLV